MMISADRYKGVRVLRTRPNHLVLRRLRFTDGFGAAALFFFGATLAFPAIFFLRTRFRLGAGPALLTWTCT
ncbi:MAG: hypothetical protein ACJ8D9_15885, partial [Xanthobacteraceae bacterium]